MADSDVSMESDNSSGDKSDEEMDTNSDSGSSHTNQPVVPFTLGQGPNANQAVRQQSDHQAKQARYGLPNMVAASSHAQPQMADSDVSMESDSSGDKSDEEMDTSSDSGSSPSNQHVVPFALGQGPNTNQAVCQQNDHQANQASYGLPNMVASLSHLQPQASDDMPNPLAVFWFLVFTCLICRYVK